MHRVGVLIDGFNLFHSIKELIADGLDNGKAVRWLDLRSLSQSFLHQIESPGKGEIAAIHYFSAHAFHKNVGDSGHVDRHNAYIRALKNVGVTTHIHRFKSRYRSCKDCGKSIKFHEEKESDVALGAKLVQMFAQKEVDTVVLVTGDTDFAPAVRCVFEMDPEAQNWFAFPYRRKNKELVDAVKGRGGGFNIKPISYAKHILPDPVTTNRRKLISKPVAW